MSVNVQLYVGYFFLQDNQLNYQLYNQIFIVLFEQVAGNQEGNIKTLKLYVYYLDRFSSKNLEHLSSGGSHIRKLSSDEPINLVIFSNTEADPAGVYGRLDQKRLFFVSSQEDGLQDQAVQLCIVAG